MNLADIIAGNPMGSTLPTFGAKPPVGTPPFAMPHPQTGGADMVPAPGQQQHGLSGFIDRLFNPTNALGQFGQALVAGGGSLSDAMGYLMQSRAAQAEKAGKFGEWQQQYDYELNHPKPSTAEPDVFSRTLIAAGIDPNSEQGKAMYRQRAATLASPAPQMVGNADDGYRWVTPPSPSLPGPPPNVTFTPIGGPTPQASGGFPVTGARLDRITAQGESGGRRYGADGNLLRSPVGAMGEMQVMPSTARAPGFGIKAWDGSNPDDLARVGRDYRATMQHRYGGDTAKMWAAYNWGPGNVDSAIQRYGDNWLDHAPAETRAYVTRNRRNLMGGN